MGVSIVARGVRSVEIILRGGGRLVFARGVGGVRASLASPSARIPPKTRSSLQNTVVSIQSSKRETESCVSVLR